MIKLLHFADAHIDMAGHGRRDPESGLPYRVLDFLKALDTIVDTAISEKVDLVIFAGDAYKDRTPVPTFQREWGKRMLRLSQARIQTLLVVGNHDLSPALGRAHALQEYETLQIPYIQVISKPCLLGPDDLNGLPVQVIGLPWITRSGMMANVPVEDSSRQKILSDMEERIGEFISLQIEKSNPDLPLLLSAHCSVQGAKYGSERSVMLGSDLVLSSGLVTDPRLDYVALGHIHKSQDLNEGHQPPVVYPGSIERVDFGEAADEKNFVLADIQKGKTDYRFVRLNGRPFFDKVIHIESDETNIQKKIMEALPSNENLQDAMVRVTLYYPKEIEPLIDESTIRRAYEVAFEFHLLKKPQQTARFRLPTDQSISSKSAFDLFKIYMASIKLDGDEDSELSRLAADIIQQAETGEGV